MKAWVPDWRQVIDPQYDERQEAAAAPKDDALGVWLTVPEDLARLVQPRYERVRQSLSADEAKLANGLFGGDDDAAVLTYHVAGLVRFLMDSYPLVGSGDVPPTQALELLRPHRFEDLPQLRPPKAPAQGLWLERVDLEDAEPDALFEENARQEKKCFGQLGVLGFLYVPDYGANEDTCSRRLDYWFFGTLG
ncbi:hypothetical protein AK812_SmicGene23075 [Symbiodinium microadriaticum]|uniref:Uncharacterized protein n=1 Tax=Symbiodinium microadriaticum TaxID=2951 RepID=A0A1Q9DIA3_SYMMI|nr:hypothetical protein AK812_SmicGene23075 [Symbiodinium microadriaticum]